MKIYLKLISIFCGDFNFVMNPRLTVDFIRIDNNVNDPYVRGNGGLGYY
jgi:hypothetical protein